MISNLSSYQYISLFFVMLFCHIVDDYYLQGILTDLKQRDWWKKQVGYDSFYEYDYITALMCHGFSWSFMINLPLLVISNFNVIYIYIFIAINFVIHCIVDNEKANKKTINLKTDQLIHVLQVFSTWTAFLMLCVH